MVHVHSCSYFTTQKGGTNSLIYSVINICCVNDIWACSIVVKLYGAESAYSCTTRCLLKLCQFSFKLYLKNILGSSSSCIKVYCCLPFVFFSIEEALTSNHSFSGNDTAHELNCVLFKKKIESKLFI